MTAALERGEWSAARPGRTLPPGKTLYPLYRRLGGPQGRSGRRKISTTGIRYPDRPACSQSLYRLSYPYLENGSTRLHRNTESHRTVSQATIHQSKYAPLELHMSAIFSSVVCSTRSFITVKSLCHTHPQTNTQV